MRPCQTTWSFNYQSRKQHASIVSTHVKSQEMASLKFCVVKPTSPRSLWCSKPGSAEAEAHASAAAVTRLRQNGQKAEKKSLHCVSVVLTPHLTEVLGGLEDSHTILNTQQSPLVSYKRPFYNPSQPDKVPARLSREAELL